MPTKIEKDSVTGTETTGHEWDGIKELNSPLPRWWLWVFYATIAWSVGYWVVYPAWPGITGYTSGLLGYSERVRLDKQVAEARDEQASYYQRLAALDVGDIPNDPDLLNFAIAAGASGFKDNCAPCHGSGGAGGGGYPSLVDDAWIWGGDVDNIHATILYGIRSAHEDTRQSEMPRFGTEEILSEQEINDVTEHVLSLSGDATDAVAAARGFELFAENCAVCHGEEGEGNAELGAPRLNDQIWLYGGDKDDIVAQITQPSHGNMPAWVGRLDETTIKMLTVYVYALGGGE